MEREDEEPQEKRQKRQKRGPSQTVEPNEKQDLFDAAVCCVESAIVKAAKDVASVLTAPYDTSVFADTIYSRCSDEIAALNVDIRIEKNCLVPVVAFGKVVGFLKIPICFSTQAGRVLMLLEIKTKRAALKELDLENFLCAAEQISLTDKEGFRPRSMIVNFSSGEHSIMTLLSDGSIRN
jgi:hypothetical protein